MSTISMDDLVTYFSAMTYDEIRRDAIYMMLTSSEWTQPWVAGDNTVNIPVPGYKFVAGTTAGTITDPGDSTGIKVVDRARGGDWAPLAGVSSSTKKFTRTGEKASSQFIPYEDSMEVAWNVAEEYRSRAAYEIRDALDSAIVTALWSAPANTTSLGDGSAGIMIDKQGKLGTKTAESAALVYDAISAWSLLLEERDLMSEASDSPGSAYVVIHPRLFTVLREYLLDKNLSWDALTSQLLSQNSVLASRGYRGRILNVDVFTSTKAPLPGGSSKNTVWNILCGTQRANTVATRPPLTQFFPISQNQITDEPGTVLRQTTPYGFLTLDGELRMQTIAIDAHATDLKSSKKTKDADADADADTES